MENKAPMKARRFLDGGANEVLQVMTTVVAVGAVFFGLAPWLALWAFCPVPVVLWGSFLFQRRIAPRYQDVRERVAHLNGQLANNLGGIATIKSFTAEAHEVERVRQGSDAYRESNRSAIKLSSAFSPLIRRYSSCVIRTKAGLPRSVMTTGATAAARFAAPMS